MGEIRRDKGSGEKPQWMAVRGRWRARYTDANGKRRAVFSYVPGRKGERECAKRRDEKVAAVQAGVDLGRAATKVTDYLTRWLRLRVDLRPRSRQKYEGSVRLHIDPFIGGMTLSRLRTPRINDLYAELLAAGRSPDTVRYTHSVLHSALTFAVQEHTLTANPADHAKIPRKGKTNIHPFTPAETTELLAGIVEDPLEVLIILALRTAMRLGELLGLRWSDVDPATGNLQVLRELYRFEGAWLTDDPKNGKTRAISVTADTIEMLRAYRIERSEALLSIRHRVTDDDPIFLTDEGQPFDGHHLTERRVQPLLKRLGLPRRRFHDLRHTAATLMLAGGIHPKVVSEMLGHSTVEMTMDRYAHVLPTMQAEAARALEAMTVRAAR